MVCAYVKATQLHLEIGVLLRMLSNILLASSSLILASPLERWYIGGGLEYCIMDHTTEYRYEVFWHLDTLPITAAMIQLIRCSNHRTELDCYRVDASKKSACCWVHVIVEAFN